MDATAVDLARNRLYVAEIQCARLQSATDHLEAELAWSAFLSAAATEYSKLEQGAKVTGKSKGWYARKKKTRKDDPLLRYLHRARNSDEHGTEHVTHRNTPTIDDVVLGFKPEHYGKQIPLQMQKVDPATNEAVGPVHDVTLEGPNIVLRTVTDDRFKDSCDPPHEHLGKPIAKPTAQAVSLLGLIYLKEMISEAENLVAQAP